MVHGKTSSPLPIVEGGGSSGCCSSTTAESASGPNIAELAPLADGKTVDQKRPVILINPKATYAEEIAQKCFPPINLLLLAACLEAADIPVQVIDANALHIDDDRLAQMAREQNALLIGVPVYAETLYNTARTVEAMKRGCPDAKIVTGGPQASAEPGWMLRDVPEIDFVLVGDAEESLISLVRYLRSGQDPTDRIEGLYTRGSKNPPGGRGPRVQNLDDIPLPARHLVQEAYDRKLYYALMIAQRPVDTMITSRGCPHRCHFCYNVDTKMRYRSIDNCLEEMQILRDQGITNIEILDDNFTAHRSRAIDFFNQLRKANLGVTLRVKARADAIREDMVKAAAEAGVYNMSIGMESGSDRVLKHMNKKITVKHLFNAADIVKRHGVQCHTGWILGYPSETPETIEETTKLIRKMKPTTAGVGILRPYPGTALYDQVKADGSLVGDWSATDPKPPWVRLPWVDSYEDMVSMLKKMTRRIYFRPYYFYAYGRRIATNANLMMAKYAVQEFSRALPFSSRKLAYEQHAPDFEH